MTQQEFDNIYSSIRLKLIALAGRFSRASSAELDAEDMAQEAFIAFWQLSVKGYPIRNPEALLVKITKNICISRLRKQKLKLQPLDNDNVTGGEPASKDTDRMDEAVIKAALYECLTKSQKEYMTMRAEEGLSLDEIALKTGKPKPAIKTALSKAKKKLKEQFNRG